MCKLMKWISLLFGITSTEPQPPSNVLPSIGEPPPIVVPDPVEPKRSTYVLAVGINNYPNSPLSGCVYDIADNMRTRLINQFNVHPDNLRMLLDTRATCANILDRLDWLTSHEKSELIFLYSGHGTYVQDRNGDEVDGVDEVMVCYDHDWDDPLIDDKLGEKFDQTPDSSFLTFITDSCHSESQNRSLKNSKQRPRFLQPPRDIAVREYLLQKNIRHAGTKKNMNNFVIFSGCRDDQTSADAYIDGQWQGAFTWSYSQLLDPEKTWVDIYQLVVSQLSTSGFSQVPQLNGANLESRLIFGGK